MWEYSEIDTLGDTPGSIGGGFGGGGQIGGSFGGGGGQISGSGSGSAGYNGTQAAIAQQQAAAAQQQAAYYAQMQALYGYGGSIGGGFEPGGGNGSIPFIGNFDGGTVYANADGTPNTGSNFLGNLGLGAGISTPIALLGGLLLLVVVLKR